MLKKIQKYRSLIGQQEYIQASIYYVIANIIGQGIVLVSSAIFTRMMTKADYGLVSTYSTWVLVLNTFICLNLFISVRTAHQDFQDRYDEYNSSVLLLILLSGTVITLLVIVLVALYTGGAHVTEAVIACVQSVALNVVNYMLAIKAMKNEYRSRAFLMVAPNWTHIALSIILMLIFTGNLYLAKISGNALGLLIFAVICAIALIRQARPRIIPLYWKYALRISVPSIFHTLSDLILIQCDRLMLTSMVGAEVTAEYSVVYNVGSIIVSVYQAINGAWLPWFFKKLKDGEVMLIRQCQGYYMLLFTLFSCGIMTISPELIKIISPRSYWQGIDYVAPIVVASYLIFLYAFFSTYLLYLKKTGRIAINTICTAALNLLLNYWLIPRYSAIGAVVATVISYVVLFVLHYTAIYKDGRHLFSMKAMLGNIAAITAYGLFFYLTRNMWPVRYGMFLIGVVLIYLFVGKNIRKIFNR